MIASKKRLIANDLIPLSIIETATQDSSEATGLKSEYEEIEHFYHVYKNGIKPYDLVFDEVKANEAYKQATMLINRESRFMFSRTPDFNVVPRGNVDDLQESDRAKINVLQDFVNEVLKRNKIGKKLTKAIKDCLIGRRIAWVVNFNEQSGISIFFLKALNFYVEYDADGESITKFAYYVYTKKSQTVSNQRIFLKEYYYSDDGYCTIKERVYDGAGSLIEDMGETKTDLNFIPCGVIINDGLIGEVEGRSDIEELEELEKSYNRQASKDIDAENGAMNPVKYLIDIDPFSTEKLTSGAGATWDLSSDVSKENAKTAVGVLAPPMTHVSAVEKTLERTKSAMHELVDVPDTSMDKMTGTITSGKGMTAVYWNLSVRCDEKMQTWIPELENIINVIIEGAFQYSKIASKYTLNILQSVNYTVNVIANYAIQSDEFEEKTSDMAEVNLNIMSRREYNKKWRKMTDRQTDEEIKRIVEESTMIDSAASFGNQVIETNEDVI